jgi:hypothetical protein
MLTPQQIEEFEVVVAMLGTRTRSFTVSNGVAMRCAVNLFIDVAKVVAKEFDASRNYAGSPFEAEIGSVTNEEEFAAVMKRGLETIEESRRQKIEAIQVTRDFLKRLHDEAKNLPDERVWS